MTYSSSYDEQVEVKVEAESDGDEDKSVKDRKEVREKSKLLKLRRREKDETSDRTVFIGNLHTNTTKKVNHYLSTSSTTTVHGLLHGLLHADCVPICLSISDPSVSYVYIVIFCRIC